MKMKQKIISALAFVLCLCFLPVMSVSADKIDLSREASLTVTYSDGESFFEGLEINIYRVADADGEDLSYIFTAVGDFKNYPVKINGITTQAEWRTLGQTLYSYIVADRLTATATAVTGADGAAYFSGLVPGLYLVRGVSKLSEEGITEFETFMTVIPTVNEDRTFNYDVFAYPKFGSFNPAEGDARVLKVVKQWKDNGYVSRRPESIKVDIYQDGVYRSTVSLSSANNWSYAWQAPLDGSVWTTVEREVPKGYTVTVNKNGSIITLTNTYAGGSDEPPQTGDTFVTWLWVLVTCTAGMTMIILSLIKKKREYQ